MTESNKKEISETFLQKASSVLGDTYGGLSGSAIIDRFCAYGEKWNVPITFSEYPCGARRKSSIFRENLKAFSPAQQFLIISELCDLKAFGPNATAREEIKLELYSKYGDVRQESALQELDLPLVQETRHWLEPYPESLKNFNGAKLKYDHGAFERNLLDDLRLALEALLQEILANNKSLENQEHYLKLFLKDHKTSLEVRNMFPRLIDYYAKYQNEHSKHKDNPVREEIEFIFELTASLMKYIVRISS
ncbi:MAG: hypothetical protein ACYC4I_01830 [Minisyncoccota bacterium]